MSYELWDTETHNLIETFESEAEAIEGARQLIAANASVYPEMLALVIEDSHGVTTVLGIGHQLTHMVLSPRQID